jgi:hypothetical protein
MDILYSSSRAFKDIAIDLLAHFRQPYHQDGTLA